MSLIFKKLERSNQFARRITLELSRVPPRHHQKNLSKIIPVTSWKEIVSAVLTKLLFIMTTVSSKVNEAEMAQRTIERQKGII